MNHPKEGQRHEKLAWGIKEAAATIGVSTSFVRKAISGKHPDVPMLKTVRAGRRVLILDHVLKEWIGINLNSNKAP